MDFPKSAYVQAQCLDQKFPGTFLIRHYKPGDNDDPTLFDYPWKQRRTNTPASLKDVVLALHTQQAIADRLFVSMQSPIVGTCFGTTAASSLPRFIDMIDYIAPDGTITSIHPEVAQAIVMREKPQLPKELLPQQEELLVTVHDWRTHDHQTHLRENAPEWDEKVQRIAEATYHAPAHVILNGGVRHLPAYIKAPETVYISTNEDVFQDIKDWNEDSGKLFQEEIKHLKLNSDVIESLDYLKPNLLSCAYAKVGDDEIRYKFEGKKTVYLLAGNSHVGHLVEYDVAGLWLHDRKASLRFDKELKTRVNNLRDGLFDDISRFIVASIPKTVELMLYPGQTLAHAYFDQVLAPALEVLSSKHSKEPENVQVAGLLKHFDAMSEPTRRAIRSLTRNIINNNDILRFTPRSQLETVTHLHGIETTLATKIGNKDVLMRTMDNIAHQAEKLQKQGQTFEVNLSALDKAMTIVAERSSTPER